MITSSPQQLAQLPGDFDRLVAGLTETAGSRLVCLIDGGSGAGKSTLANQLHAALLPAFPGLQLARLDDVYPGWFGLETASVMVSATILRPDEPGYRTWDWYADEPADWVELDPQAPIIVEGCGAITAGSTPLASATIWYERPEAERKELAIGRDGENYEQWWDIWAEQEREHWDFNHPRERADWIVTAPVRTTDLVPDKER